MVKTLIDVFFSFELGTNVPCWIYQSYVFYVPSTVQFGCDDNTFNLQTSVERLDEFHKLNAGNDLG